MQVGHFNWQAIIASTRKEDTHALSIVVAASLDQFRMQIDVDQLRVMRAQNASHGAVCLALFEARLFCLRARSVLPRPKNCNLPGAPKEDVLDSEGESGVQPVLIEELGRV